MAPSKVESKSQTFDIRKGFTHASNAQADSLCAGRHLAQLGILEIPSKDGDFGQAIHDTLKMLPHPATIEALHALPEFVALTPSQQDIAESCLKIELQKVNEFFGGDWVKAKCFREQRYWVKISPTISHSGQVDAIYRLGERGLVMDYKSLAKEKPESVENLQLRDLVCLGAGNLFLSEVGCVLIQPLATHSPTPCLYEKEDIQRSTQEMFARVLASNDPKSPRTPGEIQCEHCRAKSKCKEYNAWAGSKLPVKLDLLLIAIQDWTPAQRTQFCDNFDVAAKWLEGAWDYMEAGAKADPAFVPGYALKPNPPQRPITDLQELFNRLSAIANGDNILPDYLACMSGTKEKIAVLASRLTGLKGKALDRKLTELFAGITGEIPKKASLRKVKG